MRRFVLSAEAAADIEELHSYILLDNRAAADRLVNTVEDGFTTNENIINIRVKRVF